MIELKIFGLNLKINSENNKIEKLYVHIFPLDWMDIGCFFDGISTTTIF
jgi:hypothetical protein